MYFRIRRFEPIEPTATAPLGEAKAELQTCLDALGAPNMVWESPRGLTLAYAWMDKSAWTFNVQVWGLDPNIDGRTVFRYSTADNEYDGVVLVFDDDLKLRIVRHGLLADITRDLQRRPAFIDN